MCFSCVVAFGLVGCGRHARDLEITKMISMNWEQILTSSPAIVFYVAVVLFAFRWFKQREGWDTERWEGMIATAFAMAEKTGVRTGIEKLDFGLREFGKQHTMTYGKPPSARDLQDAALDFGKLALQMKFKPIANSIATGVVNTTTTPSNEGGGG